MDFRNIFSLTEARKNIFAIAEKAVHSRTQFTLTENGAPKVVLMSADEFESWQETLEVAHEFPALLREAAAARREYKKGQTMSLEDVVLKKKYAVPHRASKKSTKGARSR